MEREFFQTERSQNGWQFLFQKLHYIAKDNAGSQLLAKKPSNIVRNRYRDVLPIDETRVKLIDEENDYINANHVKVDDVGRSYILSQGPLQHTCGHYWQMIWEQKTAGIVMLNKCVERGMNKCYPYWPQTGEEPLQYDKFRVDNLGCEDEGFYHLTHLKLENTETNESRVVLHFHYIRWPDFGVPQTPDVFLDFLYAVRNSGVLGQDVGPCVVHCSAGIGRSGTFCLVDVCLVKLEQTRDMDSLNIQQILLDMRRQRLGLIQTPDQLRFSYIAILQGAMQILGIENAAYEYEEEEEQSEESESEELVESESEIEEDDDLEGRLERKYPNLTHAHRKSYDEDVPPPIPPRPPETFARVSPPEDEDDIPPPPPPTSLPPGPPKMHRAFSDLEEENSAKRIKLSGTSGSVEIEEYGFKVNAGGSDNEGEGSGPGENGEVEVLEESGSEDEVPPPIPPRSHSLTPERSGPLYDGFLGGKVDIYAENPHLENGASHFLGVRGGGQKLTPPLENHTSQTAPHVPAKHTHRRPPPPKPTRDSIEEEEQALLSELSELERLASRTSFSGSGGAGPEVETERGVSRESPPSRSELVAAATEDQLRPVPKEEPPMPKSELRRRQRAERQQRIANKVNAIRDNMRREEQELESEWSLPWLVIGFVIVIGYCAYYVFS